MKRRAVFLDRDGVLNRALVRDGLPFSPQTASDFVILPGVDRAVSQLHHAGLHLVVVTNQPEIARGRLSAQVLAEMHAMITRGLNITDIRVCPHDDADGCACRKPKPGMLLDAARDANLDLHGSFMVGDRWRDIAAGQRAGTRTVLIDYGYDEPQAVAPDHRAASLLDAVQWILTSAHQPR